mmetsp:Transcript_1386/g.3082  ORF Transcript_1386/g.3082 Transcript_1386/m.3082 type:complete len:105 (+) Transcript_1386:171-485(+)
MCDTSKVNDMLGGGGVAAATFSASRSVPTISAVKLRHERDKYYLIDIREAEEIAAHPLSPKSKREDDDDDDDDLDEATNPNPNVGHGIPRKRSEETCPSEDSDA